MEDKTIITIERDGTMYTGKPDRLAKTVKVAPSRIWRTLASVRRGKWSRADGWRIVAERYAGHAPLFYEKPEEETVGMYTR